MSAPASARARDMAWPIPLVPPVTRAVWPSREKSCWIDVMVSCWGGVRVRNALGMMGEALGSFETGIETSEMG
jgi:hypothetical protein